MRKLVFICALCFLLVSCASAPVKKSEKPGDLYVEGVNSFKAKKYDEAIAKFSAIRENYPFDPMALIASVKLGDAQFEKKNYLQAVSTYEDFFKAHPEDDNIPYVLYKIAESYEKLSLAIEQDQAYTLKSMERLTYLKNRYPNSTYAKDAVTKLKAMNQKLADRELYVGDFYYRTSLYNAAIMRMEYVLKKYPDAKGLDKALYCLAMSERELGDLDKSEQYLDRLRRTYPDSIYLHVKTRGKSTPRERKTLQPKSDAKAAPQVAPVYEEVKKRDIVLTPPPVSTRVASRSTEVSNPGKQGAKVVEGGNTAGEKKESGKNAKKDRGLGFDTKKPIDIVSDTMEGFDKEKYVLFKGSVVAKQEDLSIYSDTIEAYMNEANNEIEKADAKGNVKIVKQGRTATCREALFDNIKGQITLKGDVIVYSGQDKLAGDVVIYYLEEDRVVVVGEKDKRARITVQPKEESK